MHEQTPRRVCAPPSFGMIRVPSCPNPSLPHRLRAAQAHQPLQVHLIDLLRGPANNQALARLDRGGGCEEAPADTITMTTTTVCCECRPLPWYDTSSESVTRHLHCPFPSAAENMQHMASHILRNGGVVSDDIKSAIRMDILTLKHTCDLGTCGSHIAKGLWTLNPKP